MSMSTHIVAFRPANEKWNRMKAIYDSCEAAGIEIPGEVQEFFEWENPGDKPGMEVKIDKAVTEWEDGRSRQGFEVDVTKLPKDVTIIRLYNAW